MQLAHPDKLVHLLLGGSILGMAMRLVNQKHKMEDEQALLQQQLDAAVDAAERRQQRLLQQAPILARAGGLSS